MASRTLSLAARRAGAIAGNPARCTEPAMAHDHSSSIDSSVLLVCDVAGMYRPAKADEVLQAHAGARRREVVDVD